jgi:hypothetical protein
MTCAAHNRSTRTKQGLSCWLDALNNKKAEEDEALNIKVLDTYLVRKEFQ